jgi:hypothetical protein
VIVTAVLGGPAIGDRLVMAGGNVNVGPETPNPFAAVTTIRPVLAPFGTKTTILVSLQFVAVAISKPGIPGN